MKLLGYFLVREIPDSLDGLFFQSQFVSLDLLVGFRLLIPQRYYLFQLILRLWLYICLRLGVGFNLIRVETAFLLAVAISLHFFLGETVAQLIEFSIDGFHSRL